MQDTGRALWWLGVLGVSVALGGCSRSDERVGVAQQALTLTLSPPFDVEAYPALAATAPIRAVQACGSQRCLAVYGGITSFPIATRITPQGNAVDLPRLQLAGLPFAVAVGARGDEFLVQSASNDPDNATNLTYRYARVRGTDGVQLADVTALLPAERVLQIASTANSWALLTSTSLVGRRLRIFDANFQALGPALDLPLFHDGALIAAEDQYFIVDYGQGTRVSATTGQALDSTPLVLSKYGSSPTRGSYLNGVYYIAEGGGSILETRVSKDGTVLDPDDDFNQVPGGHVVYSGAIAANTNIDAETIGGKLIVAFESTSHSLYAVTVDPATGLRSGAAAAAAAGNFAVIGSTNFSLNPIGSGALLSNDFKLFAMASLASSDAQGLASVGAEKALNLQSLNRLLPTLASNGSGYLVTFQVYDGVSGSDVYATRLDASSGAFLDTPPLHLGRGDNPNVASNGSDYLVIWTTPTGHSRRLVSASGQLGPELTSASLLTGSLGTLIGLTFNGVYFGISANGLFTRLDSTGVAIDNPFKMGAVGGYSVVLADTTPTVDRRTFMVVQQTGNEGSNDVGDFLVRSQTGALITPTSTLEPGYSRPFGASDGTDFFVIARFGQTQNIKGLLVDPLTGAPVVGSNTLSIALNPQESVFAAGYDGNTFNVLSQQLDSLPGQLRLRRLDSTLTPVAGDAASGTLLNDPAMPLAGTAPGIASDGKGCSLVAYAVTDVNRLGNAIKARFVNDGATGSCGQNVVIGGSGAGGSGAGGSGAGGSGDNGAGGSVGGNGASGLGNGASAGNAGSFGGSGESGAGSGNASEGGTDQGLAGSPGGGMRSGGGTSAAGGSTLPSSAGESTSGPGDGAAGASSKSNDQGGGCGCRVSGAHAEHSWVALGLVLGLLRRRRERHRR